MSRMANFSMETARLYMQSVDDTERGGIWYSCYLQPQTGTYSCQQWLDYCDIIEEGQRGLLSPLPEFWPLELL